MRSGSTSGRASASGWTGSTRPSGSCGACSTASDFAHEGRFYTIAGRVVRAAADPGPPADPHRRLRAAQDAADGRAPRRRRGTRRARSTRSRTKVADPRGPLQGRRVATPRRSSGRSASRSSSGTRPPRPSAAFGRLLAHNGAHGRRQRARCSLGLARDGRRRDPAVPRRARVRDVIARMPAPYDRETIERLGEVARHWPLASTHAVVALAGGVGGAKLAHGLQAHLGADLTVVVNTGRRRSSATGCSSCPTTTRSCTRSPGLDNRELGLGHRRRDVRGRRCSTRYGEETWFRLGDRDLATHVVADRAPCGAANG